MEAQQSLFALMKSARVSIWVNIVLFSLHMAVVFGPENTALILCFHNCVWMARWKNYHILNTSSCETYV